MMAYEPGVFSSYFYAGVAARAAGILESRDKTLAQTYRESALKAMEWAEKDLPRSEKKDHNGKHPAVRDARNYAAAELYRLTGDSRWNTLFLDTTDFKKGPQPFRATGTPRTRATPPGSMCGRRIPAWTSPSRHIAERRSSMKRTCAWRRLRTPVSDSASIPMRRLFSEH